MLFVVRRDLQWSKQKLAVMTAHAALALFKKLYKSRNPVLMQWVSSWDEQGRGVVLRCCWWRQSWQWWQEVVVLTAV
jgi:peptidyl-tRNA hydrolase